MSTAFSPSLGPAEGRSARWSGIGPRGRCRVGDTGEHPLGHGFWLIKRVHPVLLILSHPAHARQSAYLSSPSGLIPPSPLTMSAAAPPVFSLINLSDFSVSLSTTPVFLPAFLTLCASYPALSPFFPSPRQRAWILTTIASAVMTLASLPFVRDYALALCAGGGVADVQLRTLAAVAVNRFFQAYLAADMFMGGMYYRDQIGVLTGWVHHAVYLCITEIAIRCAWAHIFCFAACMEPTSSSRYSPSPPPSSPPSPLAQQPLTPTQLPTLLGLSTLLPLLRSNTLSALTFLLTRILLHLVLLFSYARTPATRAPALILAGVFPLHAMWFARCVRGFVRRWKVRSASTAGGAIGTKTTSARHPLAPDIYPDARSLARHSSASASALTSSTTPPPQWGGVTLRLRRLRARADGWASSSPFYYPSTANASDPPGWLSSHSFTHRLAFLLRALRHSPQRPLPILRAVRPRVMVRRMSASLVKALALPSREVVLNYVLGESGRKVHAHAHTPHPDPVELHPDPPIALAGVEVEVGAS
ncbi:hypothetical protein B0H16DRAFT_1838003 [Mycena metata]|uniref:TLC domain-containing protein n=1 Tax=Mycena metata TaxID=1033252 RepID=A0AAD7NX80_9AGAR|nr:hypothetical protein B0H16DRAFT_1838003 [Mycena metata]